MEVGCSEGGTTLVLHNLHTHYILYCVCIIKQTQSGRSSGHNRGAADEVDTTGEQLGLAMQD